MSILGDHSYQNCSISVVRGDYAPLMQRMVENLEKAKVREGRGGSEREGGREEGVRGREVRGRRE